MGGVREPDGLGLTNGGPVAQAKARSHLALGGKAREAHSGAAARSLLRVRPVREGLGRVAARALEDVTGDLVTSGQPTGAVLGLRGVIELAVL